MIPLSLTPRNYQKVQTDSVPFPSRSPRTNIVRNNPKSRRPTSHVLQTYGRFFSFMLPKSRRQSDETPKH